MRYDEKTGWLNSLCRTRATSSHGRQRGAEHVQPHGEDHQEENAPEDGFPESAGDAYAEPAAEGDGRQGRCGEDEA